ncbi:MAG: hypothetical protein IAE94_15890 [Chthoniobacterales bacterium]|nr:hypothetical protein [Chthoniobacterales bacterium]
MMLANFLNKVEQIERPVVLLEGRRKISAAEFDAAEALGRLLATRLPHAVFRSGNAEGSDEAFSRGVAAVDASRLHIVAPYPGHRLNFRYPDATYDSPESMTKVQEEPIRKATIAASPHSEGLIHAKHPRLRSKAQYLIRDTMKVCGAGLPPPAFACFLVDPHNPDAGGTGHTIRVCRQAGVPFVFQNVWGKWLSTMKRAE